MKNLKFNIGKQYFLTSKNVSLLIIPSLISFVILPWIYFFTGKEFNISTDNIETFIAIIAIILGFLINFLILAKTNTTTLFHKYKEIKNVCIKECGKGDLTCLDNCEIEYKKNTTLYFYSLFSNNEISENFEEYIYNKIFFIINISVVFALLYFLSLYVVNNINLLYVLFFIFFVIFYLLNVLKLLSELYLLFSNDND